MAVRANLPRDRYYYLWVGVFFLMLFGAGFILYYSALKIDYVWRWYRIPQYFVYQEQIYVKSLVEGEVERVESQNDRTLVHVRGLDGLETYTLPGDQMLVYEGDWVYPLDRLGFIITPGRRVFCCRVSG
jgi:polar amino acid transport system permease protein